MKRLRAHLALCGGLVLAAVFASPASSASKNCSENAFICTEVAESIGYAGQYTGHDEPSALFYSNKPGSGNHMRYNLTLPKEPAAFAIDVDADGGIRGIF